MPKRLTQYRVFIGSPGGLEEERDCFRRKLDKYTEMHSEPRSVTFHPVGWEVTIGGVGRPQEIINEDLKQCDYAVFVLHDRWGSPTGGIYSSGVEEEWALAEALYKDNKVRNIALFFKKVDPRQLRDPGEQLSRVLAFKKRIEEEKRYLFRQYDTVDQFAEALEAYLASWLRDHESAANNLLAGGVSTAGASMMGMVGASPPAASPGFAYWIAEAIRLTEQDAPDYNSSLFCATKAIDAATSDIEWARARNAIGVAQFHLAKADQAIIAFTTISERFSASIDSDRRYWAAKGLLNKGITLGALGRGEEGIAVYDDLLARFGTAPEPALREQVANGLFNKAGTLGALGRAKDAIAVYDDLLARFGTAAEPALREPVAKGLFNKAVTLGALGRGEDALAVYNNLLDRFGTAAEPPLREQVAKGLFSKAVTLGALGRGEDALAVYDDLLARFGTAPEPALREPVAKGLFSKAVTLGALGRAEEEIAVYDDLLARFGTAPEPALREQVAKGLVNKGVTLGALGRGEDALAVYNDLLDRFGTAAEPALREQVAKGLFSKAVTLGALGRAEEEIAVYDDLLARFGTAPEPALREQVALAERLKRDLQNLD